MAQARDATRNLGRLRPPGRPAVRVPSFRHPLGAMLDPLLGTGFVLDRPLEPRPTPPFRERDPADYEKLMRQPGQKEARYAHLLSREPSSEAMSQTPAQPSSRISQLEDELSTLRSEFDDLKRRFEALESQLR